MTPMPDALGKARTSTGEPQGSHNYSLDLVRGLAALAVMLAHVRGFLFVQWSDLASESQTSLQFLLYGVTRIAHQSVIVFFVLSGYLVLGRSWSNRLINSKDQITRYFIARFMRVYCVHLPVVALGAVVAVFQIGTQTDKFEWTNLLLNLANLQGIITWGIGGNLALWSLGYEFWYYMFGGALLGIHSAKVWQRGISIVATIIILVGISYLSFDWLAYLPIWLVGAVIVFLPRFSDRVGVICVCIWFAALGYSMIRSDYLCHVLFAIATALNLNLIRSVQWSPWIPFQSVIRILADCSFSLYVTHYLLLVVIVQMFQHQRWAFVGVQEWIVFLCVCICLLFVAWLFASIFESRTQMVRRWVEHKILGMASKTV